MPLFRYIAHDAAGNKINDTIEASSRTEAIQQIRNLGYFPEKISGKRRTTKNTASLPQTPSPSTSADTVGNTGVAGSHGPPCQFCKRTPPNVIDSTETLTLLKSSTYKGRHYTDVYAEIPIPLCTQCKRLSRLPCRVSGALCLGCVVCWYTAMYFGLTSTKLIEGAGPSQVLIPALLFLFLWMLLIPAFSLTLPLFGTKCIFESIDHPVVEAAKAQGLRVMPWTYLYWGTGKDHAA